MHEHNWLIELGRLALLIAVGAFGGLAKLFNTDAPITTRSLLKHALGGAVAAVSGASFALWVDPGLSEKITLLIGLGVMAGFLGINAVSEFVLKRSGQIAQTKHPEIQLTNSTPHESDSTELRRLMDSGEFTEEEIQQLIAEARERRNRLRKTLGLKSLGHDAIADSVKRPH